MADPTNGGRRNHDPPNSARREPIDQRLEKLDTRLDELRNRGDPRAAARRDRSALTQGMRIASELIASILVGSIIGWQLDKWLSTTPVLLIIFFLLGTAAGLRAVLRGADALSKQGKQARQNDPEAGNGPDKA